MLHGTVISPSCSGFTNIGLKRVTDLPWFMLNKTDILKSPRILWSTTRGAPLHRMQSSKKHRYATRLAVFEPKFWLVWRDPFLRQRIFWYNRRSRRFPRYGDRACHLDYFDAILYAPFEMQFSQKAMYHAVCNGNLELVKWLHANRKEGCTKWAMNEAAWRGHFDVIRWLNENHLTETCSSNALTYAKCQGHHEIAAYLRKHKPWLRTPRKK